MVMEELTAGEGEGGGDGKRPNVLSKLLNIARTKSAKKEVGEGKTE
ncbi:unnamed protein product [marine sediment metagenome]|uniref:Uncharacterized protein n=1 Tax=marine sediment metagenome TaxID=412755 RepID=X1E105_9ZZZZ